MPSICNSCATEITDAHVTCRGFCKEKFHPACCSIDSPAFTEVMTNDQVFWMCKACSILMNDIRMRDSVRVAYESGQKSVLTAHNEIVASLKQEILMELKNEINSNFSKLINSSSMTPRSSKFSASAVISTRRRRLFGKSDRPQPPAALSGTSDSLSPSFDNFAVRPPSQKFWLYLSRISRDVTTEQVKALASRRLGTDDVDVVRLVAKGRDVSTLSFISFKVGLCENVKQKALSSSTWPRGIVFREFQDTRTNENFWKPQPTPIRTDARVANPSTSGFSAMEESSVMDQGHHDAC